jgi:hypothetical protein
MRIVRPVVVLTILAAGPVRSEAARPVVFWASDPVRPGEVVVQGGDFGKQPAIELWRAEEAGGGSQTITPLQATDDSLKFLVPCDWKAGIFHFTVNAGNQRPEPVGLNVPDPWWQQGDAGREASPSGWLRIFGKCLSFGRARIRLQSSASNVVLQPKQQECWSLDVGVPKDLADGDYHIYVHNGFGGESAWNASGTIHIAAHLPAWKTDTFDATSFGAVANDGIDDTSALQKALDAASANGGGIVTLPRGRFQLDEPIRIPPHVLLRGAGKSLTQIYWRDTPEPF